MQAFKYYAPIKIMPHYPPPGQCRGKGGAVLTLKLAYVGNLTTHHMYVL